MELFSCEWRLINRRHKFSGGVDMKQIAFTLLLSLLAILATMLMSIAMPK